MDLQLQRRRALVTGSSSGIGAATVRALAREGAAVVVHGRDRKRADSIASEIAAAGVAIGDLSTDEGAEAVHQQARAALGGSLEILINNAGGNPTGSASKLPSEIRAADYVTHYEANLLAAVRLTQLVVPDMVAAKFGRIVNVSSAVAIQPNGLGLDYSTAKAALNHYSASLAGSLKNSGVTVNTLTPGVILVDALLRFGRDRYSDPDMEPEQVMQRLAQDRIIQLPPAGRLGYPGEVAMVACMLASPALGYVTGSNYRVDGGQVRAVI